MLGMIARGLSQSAEGLQTKKKRRTVHVVCANSRVMKFQHRLCRTAIPRVAASAYCVAAVGRSR